jgi:hypothetical protein
MLWAATLAGGGMHLAGLDLIRIGEPTDALTPSPETAAELFVHNALVAAWPLALVGLHWPEIPVVRWVGDALVGSQLLVHGLVVGNAVGQRPELWRYLPHLPLEWLGLALPAATWAAAERGVVDDVGLIAAAAATTAALAAAAAVETWTVPL